MFYLQSIELNNHCKFYDGQKIIHEDYPLGAADGVELVINGQYDELPKPVEPKPEPVAEEKPEPKAKK